MLIGGGYQGKDPAVQNASATYMSADSTISADAITNGNGGTVVLWSNDSTRAYGSISARGGAQGGDGGLIETSGHWLDVLAFLPGGRYRYHPRGGTRGLRLDANGRADRQITTLTLNAAGDVNINPENYRHLAGNLVVCCGRDITLAAILFARGGSAHHPSQMEAAFERGYAT